MYNEDELYHYGTPRHSGRYPWGSGDNPYQRMSEFLAQNQELKKKGLTEKERAEALGFKTTSELRARVSNYSAETFNQKRVYAEKLKAKGMSNQAIADKMGLPNESSVRSLLDQSRQNRARAIDSTINMLKDQVADKKYIDVGVGTEMQLGVSRDRLKNAIAELREQGYMTTYHDVEQAGNPGNYTRVMVLSKPDDGISAKDHVKDIWKNIDQVQPPIARSNDNGETYKTEKDIKPPVSIDSKRVQIRYAEDTDAYGAHGVDKDGVIELRKGVDDISLGKSNYAQVRIAVDGTHYLKGMAMYSDNMPDGVDVIFNTNKHKGTPMMDVLKPLKSTDPETNASDAFGATIKPMGQRTYVGKDGKEHQSVVNIVNEEGDWTKWSKNLASQMLSKQPVSLAKEQLGLSLTQKKSELDDILSLTNPAVKKKLLEEFANDCDASSVHLKAAGLPRQASHVLLPINSLKENEIYAPKYKDGEKVVLIRYPHAGTFEIPELIVNNKNKEANSVMFNAADAVGINSKVAERLSGADFDGDTALVIPNNQGKIKTSEPLRDLVGFDPKVYKVDHTTITNQQKQTQMGVVSNLITDMTLRNATPSEMARAVKHSMVVIDSEKHHLDWRASEKDNNINELKEKYQKAYNPNGTGGASTLISKAKSEKRVNRTKAISVIDPETGKRAYGIDPLTGKKATTIDPKSIYTESYGVVGKKKVRVFSESNGDMYYLSGKKGDKDRTKVPYTGDIEEVTKTRQKKSTKMAETEDAFTISSGTAMENVYASYANQLKGMANTARKESIGLKQVRNPQAAKVYAKEVSELNDALLLAKSNAPYERQAQIIANSRIKINMQNDPDMSKDQIKKMKGRELQRARVEVGAGKEQIQITRKQWEAIQAGAVSHNQLESILANSNMEIVKQYANPRKDKSLPGYTVASIKAMDKKGYQINEIAQMLGVSSSQVSDALH